MRSAGRWLRDVILRLILVFLAVSLCSFLTLDRPVLRQLYEATTHFGDYLVNIGRYWGSLGETVGQAYARSMVLLVGAIAVGLVLGVPAGLVAGLRPTTWLGRLVAAVSNLGILTPSFLWGLAVMVFFVRYLNRYSGVQWILLRPGGELLDPRYILAPALTLAARPMAYIAYATATAVREEMAQDYIRTARSKGLSGWRVVWRHLWPNASVGVLGAANASFIFALSSLPVVEFIFSWPGVGLQLLTSILRSNAHLSALLLASVGLTFVLTSVAVDLLGQRLDPRLRLEEGLG